MRILAVIEATTITGPAKNLIQFGQDARGVGVELGIATFTRGGSTNLFIETVNDAGLRCFPIPESSAFDRSVNSGLADAVRRFQPDLLQTHAVKSHFVARSSGLYRRLPWIAFHHGYTWPNLRMRLYNQFDRWSLRGAQYLVTVCEAFAKQLVAMGIRRERIFVIHNAIAPEWGRRHSAEDTVRLRESLNLPAGAFVFLIVGRLSREKDHITLLRALARVRKAQPSACLIIVGDGPERPRIETEISRLGLGGCVTLAGQQRSAEPYYGIADAAVLSSLTEGSPNALLEAMSAGVPVVATAVGGVPDIASDRKTALLVPPSDEAAMTTALRELMENPELAREMAQKSRDLAMSEYSPAARADRLIALYGTVIHGWQSQ